MRSAATRIIEGVNWDICRQRIVYITTILKEYTVCLLFLPSVLSCSIHSAHCMHCRASVSDQSNVNTLNYHTSNSRWYKGINGEALQLHAVHKKLFFTTSHARIRISTASHAPRIHIRHYKSRTLRLNVQWNRRFVRIKSLLGECTALWGRAWAQMRWMCKRVQSGWCGAAGVAWLVRPKPRGIWCVKKSRQKLG